MNAEAVQNILTKWESHPKFLIEILQDVQETYNHLPEDVLREISGKIEVPMPQILHIATFYKAFSLTPRGKYLIQVCAGTACHVKGAPRIVDAISRELGIEEGGTTDDLLFSLEAVRCVGCCGLAPVVIVGKDIYGKTNSAKIPKVLKKYQKEKEE